MPITKSFASDNNSGVHPEILEALQRVNEGHVVAYGDDPYTAAACAAFATHFGKECLVHFVWNGTGANVLCIQTLLQPYQFVITTETSHIHVDECSASEAVASCKVVAVPTTDGKLRPENVTPLLHGFGDPHHPQPGMISITQATELGTVYEPAEIQALADLAHSNNMVLHMDGARLANAAVFLDCSLRELTLDCGVDALSFGGTKNGLMYGEAVVFFRPALAEPVEYFRKQSMQLASKMRYIGAQFETLLADDLWQRNARQANAMASLLSQQVSSLPGVEVFQPTQANGVFARLPKAAIAELQSESFFYVWDESKSEVRWMCSFDTTEEEVKQFAAKVQEITTRTM